MEFNELTKSQMEFVISGAKVRYELLKREMDKRSLPFSEWVDLNDQQQEAWAEFFWELLDLEG